MFRSWSILADNKQIWPRVEYLKSVRLAIEAHYLVKDENYISMFKRISSAQTKAERHLLLTFCRFWWLANNRTDTYQQHLLYIVFAGEEHLPKTVAESLSRCRGNSNSGGNLHKYIWPKKFEVTQV